MIIKLESKKYISKTWKNNKTLYQIGMRYRKRGKDDSKIPSLGKCWDLTGILKYHRYLNGYSLNILQSLCVREIGSHWETSAVPLQGIIGAVMVTLLILGGGLYLWKTCGMKKNTETAMWRQVALLPLVPDTCFFPLGPGSLSCILLHRESCKEWLVWPWL